MSIYVIRHGKTKLNSEKKYNCRINEDIIEEGILQAKSKSEEIKSLGIDIVYCSPMLRTRHTLECLDIPHIPVIFDDRFMERDGGVVTGTTVEDDFYENVYYNYFTTQKVEGLESLPDLFKRVHNALNEIKEKYSDKNILIVTHGGVAKAIYYYFNELPKDGHIAHNYQKNSEIVKYDF